RHLLPAALPEVGGDGGDSQRGQPGVEPAALKLAVVQVAARVVGHGSPPCPSRLRCAVGDVPAETSLSAATTTSRLYPAGAEQSPVPKAEGQCVALLLC